MKVNRIEKMLRVILGLFCLILVWKLYESGAFEKSQIELEKEENRPVYRKRTLTEEGINIPKRYDLREHNKQPIVKNQGSLGTCWAIAASSALESRLLPEEKMVFSADHISMQNQFAQDQNDGGDYSMVMAYLAGWRGPVFEEDDPYGDGITQQGLAPVKHIQNMQILKKRDFESVKKAVYTYGAVQSSVYMDLKNAFSSSVYYNQLEYSYYYPGEETANHDILIIGWDDDYPAEKFNYKTKKNGAFICQNSWGTEFGDEGVFYISYEDVNIGNDAIVYAGIENTDNYDKMDQTDLCGWVGQLGYGDSTCHFANTFEADESETLEAVGFYATGADTEYKIMVLDEGRPLSDALMEEPVAEGRVENAGFYTIPLEEVVSLREKEKYTVVIKIKTPDAQYPVATEFAADQTTENVDISDGDGYISHNGAIWRGTETEYGCNVCMKVYLNRS